MTMKMKVEGFMETKLPERRFQLNADSKYRLEESQFELKFQNQTLKIDSTLMACLMCWLQTDRHTTDLRGISRIKKFVEDCLELDNWQRMDQATFESYKDVPGAVREPAMLADGYRPCLYGQKNKDHMPDIKVEYGDSDE